MKNLFLILMLISHNVFANTLVQCVVPSPRNVLTLDIEDNHQKATLTELNGSPVNIESQDGQTFYGNDFFGIIRLAPGVYASKASRTHAVLTTQAGNQIVLNCMKRNIPSPVNQFVPGFEACQVTVPDYGNPHRNYDAKFRLCRAKSNSLGFQGEDARRCSAICMKN